MSASRTKRYREKLKLPENAAKLIKLNENAKTSSANYRNRMRAQGNTFQLKRSIQTSDYRKRKAAENDSPVSVGYDNYRQVKYAAKTFERYLPVDPLKRNQLVQQLSLNVSKTENDSDNEEEEENYAEPSDLHNSIKQFYHREDISREMPGMKQFKSVKTSSGIKEKFQAQYLTMTIGEAFEIFKLENPDVLVSKSTFNNLRPAYILPSNKTPHDVCSCKYHQNIKLIFDSIQKYIIDDLIESVKDLIIKLVCCTDNFDCMFGKCAKCMNFEEKLSNMFLESSKSRLVKLVQWENFGISERNESMLTVDEVIRKFQEQLISFKKHSYTTKVQNEKLQELKKNVDETYAIVQSDFAENYSIEFQHETQEFHFQKPQIAIYTVAVTSKNFYQSYAIVSDETDHGKYTVWTFRKFLFANLKQKLPNLKKIFDFTDGCAQQFKNTSTLSCLAFTIDDFGLSSQHHFMSTSHGKGQHDGIGAIIKRRVRQEVLSKNLKVSNAAEFCDVAKTVTTKIEILLVNESDIKECKTMLDERWSRLKPWEGIRSCHYFNAIDKTTMQAAFTSRLDGLKSYEMFLPSNLKAKTIIKKPLKYVKKTVEERKNEAVTKKLKIEEKKKKSGRKKKGFIAKENRFSREEETGTVEESRS